MCGILGVISKGCLKISPEVFHAALNAISHRGPDFSDSISGNNYFLGHNRLSIIDLDVRSNQPFVDEATGLILLFNGEIYNYKELRRTLIQKGCVFKTEGDTEVVLQAYKTWGKSFVQYLDGMFAIAIYHPENDKLILVRDHFGKKPLFYYFSLNQVAFSSEILPINMCLGNNVSLNEEAANQFLAIGYVLQPLTIYKQIFQVEAGQMISINTKDDIVEKENYFKLESWINPQPISVADAKEKLRLLLEQSIRKRLIGDVSMGLFLSGGVDSSIIACYLKKILNVDCRYFSYSFADVRYDELSKAKKLAEVLSVRLHEVCDKDIIEEDIFRFVSSADYIPSDNAIFPLSQLSAVAKESVKFVLTGDGSDELFGGYVTNKADMLNRNLYILKYLKDFTVVKRWSEANDSMGWKTKLTRFVNGADRDYRKAHYQWRMIFSPEERIKILGEDKRDLVYDTDPFDRFLKYYNDVADADKFNQHAYVDMKTWLCDNILVKSDRATMMAGLESRSPFLDLDFVKYSFSLPVNYKKNKSILKSAMDGIVPDFVLNQKKSGFNSSFGAWMGINTNEFKWLTKYLYQHYEKGLSNHTGV